MPDSPPPPPAYNDSRAKQEQVAADLEELARALKHGEALRALPEIEARLTLLHNWWQGWQSGQAAAVEAPHAEAVLRGLLRALELLRQAHLGLGDWAASLAASDRLEDFQQRYLQDNPGLLARTRFNRYAPLVELGRLEAAQAVLEECLKAFHALRDISAQAKVFDAFADLMYERGQTDKAVELARQAVTLYEHLEQPESLARAHGNLAFYLYQAGHADAAARHSLAELVYDLLRNDRQRLSTDLESLKLFAQCAREEGKTYALPKLAELLEQTEFANLRGSLRALRLADAQVQALVDEVVRKLEQMRVAGES